MREARLIKNKIETYLRNAGRAYSHSSLSMWHQPKRTRYYIRHLLLSIICIIGRKESVERVEKVAKRGASDKCGKSYKVRRDKKHGRDKTKEKR